MQKTDIPENPSHYAFDVFLSYTHAFPVGLWVNWTS